MTRRYTVHAEDGSILREVTEYDGVGNYQLPTPLADKHPTSETQPAAATTTGQPVCLVHCDGLEAYVPVLRPRAKNTQER